MDEKLKALAQQMKDGARDANPKPGDEFQSPVAVTMAKRDLQILCSPANITALVDGYEGEIADSKKYQHELLEDIVTQSSEIASLREQLAITEAIESDLRKEWWFHHGCSGGQYGDDGEMQCCMIDFKRTPLDSLRIQVDAMRWKNRVVTEQLKQCQEGK